LCHVCVGCQLHSCPSSQTHGWGTGHSQVGGGRHALQSIGTCDLPGSSAQGPHGADLPASAWGLWALQPGARGGVPSCCLLTPVLVTSSVGLGGTQVRHHHCIPGVWRLQGRLGPAALGKRGGRSPAHPGLAPPSARHLNTHSLPQFLPHNHESGTISPILLNKETELRS